jgi:hypothetical protein
MEANAASNPSFMSNEDENLRSGGYVGHRLLIQPHAHNILVVYEPTMSFMSKIDANNSG